MSEYRGTFNPLRQRYTEKWSPTSGYVREHEWKGFDLARVRNYANLYARAGCQYDLEQAHGLYTLKAIDTTGEVTIDSWEIGVNQEFVSSLQNPFNIANCDPGELDLIGCAISNGITIAEAKTKLEADNPGSSYSDELTSAHAARLYIRMQQGDDTFLAYRYVLRHTTNVSNRYAINVADQYVGYIYTTAQLLSETQNPSSWVYPLPGRLAYKILSLPYPSAEQGDDDYHIWGWHKGASSESTAANNRVNIVTEYVLGLAKTDEYLLR